MRQAVIVSYARTGLAKAARGGFNNTSNMDMLGHAVQHAVARSKVDPAEVEDVIAGCVAGSGNVARAAALLAGLPITTSGMTMHRACSSGLNAIAAAAHHIVEEGASIMVGGGVDSISFQGGGGGGKSERLTQMYPDFWMPMIDTADIVAERYGLSREYQDEYSLRSQKLMAAAQAAGKFKDEIVPMKTKMKVVDKVTKAESIVDYTVDRDECNRPDTTMEGLSKLEPVKGPGKYITAGNASQLSDGAAAVVVMERSAAEKKGLAPLGVFKGWAVAGCEP
ncbi:MAG TPA: beta-ketoacyl synthase N-terminal-like domain-containing protein, partial [Quisquiliibacterium sp.]|nr:beta-ketoacyl synthase N-terminal-like domain-containing protein [Quisquiliibacterium sp.]